MNLNRTLFLTLLSSVPLFGANPVRFAWESIKHPGQVGAAFECTAAVGEELLRSVKEHKGPRKLLELGAGMGSITTVIVKNLRAEDTLDVIEINPKYCAHLCKRFSKEKYPNVAIHCADMLEFNGTNYDAIICTLPFNIFPQGLIARMQSKIESFVKTGGYMSYVEYALFPKIRAILTRNKVTKKEIKARKDLMDAFKKKYEFKSVLVVKNAPPLYVHHLRM